ncbi:MAG: hypothetical protein FJ100_16395, partial [Deltaproteobacteria bacterium]|nr:hypothetical protein [Deltaproteobacteria bacterium]
MPRNKAAPAAEPTAVAAAPAAPDPATPVRRPGRKRAVHDAPLLDLAARGDVAMPRGTTAASDFGSAAATDSAAVALAPSVRDVHPPGQVGAVPAEDQTDAGQQVADLAPA